MPNNMIGKEIVDSLGIHYIITDIIEGMKKFARVQEVNGSHAGFISPYELYHNFSSVARPEEKAVCCRAH